MDWVGYIATATTVLATALALVGLYRERNWRWVLVTFVLSFVAAGRLLRAAGDPVWSVGGFPIVARDLTDLAVGSFACLGVPLIGRAVAARLREAASAEQSEMQLRQIIDLVPHMIFAKDWDARFLLANKALAEAYGQTAESLIGEHQRDFQVSEEELAHFLADDRAVMSSGEPKFIPEEPFTDQDGNVRVLETTKIPFTASGMTGPAMLGVAVDITERKRATESLERTLLELDHRVKNTLAMVQAIAEKSAVNAESVDSFVSDFRGRIRAMSNVHEALRERAWCGVELGVLLSQAVEPYRRDQESITLEGPDVFVPVHRVQSLGMAFHELVSNAAKHGSLLAQDGRIDVCWRVEPGTTGNVAHIEWRESNGPTVSPPHKRGMGLLILEKGLKHEADADSEIRFEPTGLCAEIVMPLDESLPAAATTGEAPST
jgi:PAS domain S-box-containing protein